MVKLKISKHSLQIAILTWELVMLTKLHILAKSMTSHTCYPEESAGMPRATICHEKKNESAQESEEKLGESGRAPVSLRTADPEAHEGR